MNIIKKRIELRWVLENNSLILVAMNGFEMINRSRFGDVLADAIPMARENSALFELGLIAYLENPDLARVVDRTRGEWYRRRWLEAVTIKAKALSKDTRRFQGEVAILHRRAS
jgi:hypothetical protein